MEKLQQKQKELQFGISGLQKDIASSGTRKKEVLEKQGSAAKIKAEY